MEQHGIEQLSGSIGLDAEVILKTLGKQVDFLVIASLELGETLGAHVGFDDGEQEIAVGEVIAMAVKLFGPDLGQDFSRIGAAGWVGGEQRCGVFAACVSAQLKEDIFLGTHVFIESGVRPAQTLRDSLERDLVVALFVEKLVGSLLDLRHTLLFLCAAARPDEIRHDTPFSLARSMRSSPAVFPTGERRPPFPWISFSIPHKVRSFAKIK